MLGTAPDYLIPDYLIKGYNAGGGIVYGTGVVVESEGLAARAEVMFTNRHVAYIHVRSARNNCYATRIDRGS